jgi:hypothetical protein
MEKTKNGLTVEEAMKKAGLEIYVNDEEAKAIMQLDARGFYRHCSSSLRSSVRMLRLYNIIKPEGLPNEAQQQYYSMVQKEASNIEKLIALRGKRTDYLALIGNHA